MVAACAVVVGHINCVYALCVKCALKRLNAQDKQENAHIYGRQHSQWPAKQRKPNHFTKATI